jgi:Xaa-Pro aminopeptidase
MFRRALVTVVLGCVAIRIPCAQAPLFTDVFPIEEFAARRARVMDRIDGVAILPGAAHPGMYEYELEAITDYFFKKNNSQGIAYFALVASGKKASYPHYHAAQSKLADGDLVLFDYAPDYKYYTSDVTRMFPANGRFTAAQRELYTGYLKMYQAVMSSIQPNVEPDVILANAARKMQDIVAVYPFSSEARRAAAKRFADAYKNDHHGSLGHWVGMEVHDITDLPAPGALKPGMVFTIEPALTIPEDRVYIRIEDPIVITSSGYENLSAFAPVEPDQIERLMAEDSPFNRFDKRTQPTSGTQGPLR